MGSKSDNVELKIAWLSKTFAIIVFAISIFLFVSCFFHVSYFTNIIHKFESIQLNSSVGFIFAAIALWLLNKPYKPMYKITILFCGALICCIGLFTTYEYDKSIHIFQILFLRFVEKNQLVTTTNVERIAPLSALSFLLLGLALTLACFKRTSFIYIHILCLFIFSISFFSLSGYLFGLEFFTGFLLSVKMSIYSILAFIVLSIGIMLQQGNYGIVKLFTDIHETIAGKIAYSSLLIIFPIELLLGVLHAQAEKYNLYGNTYGIAIFTLLNIAIIAAIILWNANKLQIEEKNKNMVQKELAENVLRLSSRNSQLNDFINIVCHNLRGPLSSITMITKFIDDTENFDEKVEMMANLNPVTESLNEVFNELVTSLQIKNDLEIESENNQLEQCVKSILGSMEPQLKKTHASLITDFSEAPVLFYPKKYIVSILYNLISNALKYRDTTKNPLIKIIAKKINDKVVLSVSDNGLGLDTKMHKDNLFKIGKVFHNHPEAKGFGLFMTRSQVEAMGGRIWVESSPGAGATFFVEFRNQNI